MNKLEAELFRQNKERGQEIAKLANRINRQRRVIRKLKDELKTLRPPKQVAAKMVQ